MHCSGCEREDFASSLRCQWCGTPLQEGVPVLAALANGAQALTNAPALAFAGAPGAAATSPPSTASPAPSLRKSNELDSSKDKDGAKKKGLGGLVGIVLLALSKLKVLLGALKFGKLATTFGSMLVSIGFYALLFGWTFAVGFVLLIFVHEMGHVLALKRRGIPIEGMFFIPFLGAAVSFKKRPRDPAVDAEISWAGPFAGTLGGAVCFGVYLATHNVFWLVLAHVTFLLNLINLSPSVPLDGGWIVKAINPKFSLIGSVVGIGVGLYLHSTLLVIIAALGAFHGWSAWRAQDDDLDAMPITPQARMRVTAAYLGLMLILGVSLGYSTHVLHEDRAARDNNAALSTRASQGDDDL